MNRPALRGEIRDASGITLVQSRLAVVVRADPVLLGPFSEDVARIAAPILALPESEVLSRLQPIYFPYTNLVVLTNGPVVSTNRQVVTRARRANMVATNISVEAWDRLMAALDTNRFTAEIALRAEREQLKERQRVHRETLAWWNLPARWQVHRAELAECASASGTSIRRRLSVVEGAFSQSMFTCDGIRRTSWLLTYLDLPPTTLPWTFRTVGYPHPCGERRDWSSGVMPSCRASPAFSEPVWCMAGNTCRAGGVIWLRPMG